VVDRALDRVGLTELARRPVGELSGGQQQRVFFARALAQEASLYLLDEPFAAVDALTTGFLSGLLRDLAAEGVGVVVVNHDLSTIHTLCDRLVLLDVAVIASGTPREVLTPAALARAYGGAPALAEVSERAAAAGSATAREVTAP
jgi:manganese/zinc/iron transport system ATP- binding protein